MDKNGQICRMSRSYNSQFLSLKSCMWCLWGSLWALSGVSFQWKVLMKNSSESSAHYRQNGLKNPAPRMLLLILRLLIDHWPPLFNQTVTPLWYSSLRGSNTCCFQTNPSLFWNIIMLPCTNLCPSLNHLL